MPVPRESVIDSAAGRDDTAALTVITGLFLARLTAFSVMIQWPIPSRMRITRIEARIGGAVRTRTRMKTTLTVLWGCMLMSLPLLMGGGFERPGDDEPALGLTHPELARSLFHLRNIATDSTRDTPRTAPIRSRSPSYSACDRWCRSRRPSPGACPRSSHRAFPARNAPLSAIPPKKP